MKIFHEFQSTLILEVGSISTKCLLVWKQEHISIRYYYSTKLNTFAYYFRRLISLTKDMSIIFYPPTYLMKIIGLILVLQLHHQPEFVKEYIIFPTEFIGLL